MTTDGEKDQGTGAYMCWDYLQPRAINAISFNWTFCYSEIKWHRCLRVFTSHTRPPSDPDACFLLRNWASSWMDSYLEPKLCWLNTPTLWTSASPISSSKSLLHRKRRITLENNKLNWCSMFKFREFFRFWFFVSVMTSHSVNLMFQKLCRRFLMNQTADSFNYKQFSLIEASVYCVVEVLKRGSWSWSSVKAVTMHCLRNLLEVRKMLGNIDDWFFLMIKLQYLCKHVFVQTFEAFKIW